MTNTIPVIRMFPNHKAETPVVEEVKVDTPVVEDSSAPAKPKKKSKE